MILLAGDCTGSAYIFAPQLDEKQSRTDKESRTTSKYNLAFEIECGSTVCFTLLTKSALFSSLQYDLYFLGVQVGSAAVSSVNDGTGDVNIYVPSYELNKVRLCISTCLYFLYPLILYYLN